MLRTSRLQCGQPGSTWTLEERQAFEDSSVTFLRKRQRDTEGGGAAAVTKKAKMLVQQDRRASLDILNMIQGELSGSCGEGLERWQAQPPTELGLGPPPFITFTMDWEQVQWCAGFFLRNKLKLFVELIPDVEHVRNANLAHATTFAGLDLIVAKSHCCNNVRRGPWNGKAWSAMFRQGALAMAKNLHPNSAWMLFFWPETAESLGLGEEYRGESGRLKFLQDLPALALNSRDPPTSSPQRWMSLQKCAQYLDPYVGVDRMIMSFVCMQKGLAENFEDLLPSAKLSKNMAVEVAAIKAMPDAAVSDEPAPAASASAAAVVAPAVPTAKPKAKSIAKAKAKAKAAVRQDLQAAKGTLLQVARYKMDDDFVYNVRRYCAVSQAEVDAHSDYLSNVHDAESTLQFFADQAAGKYGDTFAHMINNGFSLPLMSRCGFKCDPSFAEGLTLDSDAVLLEDAQGHSMLQFTMGILINRAASMAWHDMCWPGLTALFVHKDPARVADGLALLALDWKAQEWANKQSAKGAMYAKSSFLHGSVMAQIVRIFISDGWHRVPPVLVRWFRLFWSGLLSSVPNERANKILRECEDRDCPSKATSRLKRWEALRLSTLPKQYERRGLEVSDFIDTPKDVQELMATLFEYVDPTPPLPLDRILGSQDWDTFNSMSIRGNYAQLHVMREAFRNKDPLVLSSAWASSMIPVGQVVCKREEDGHVSDAFLTLANHRIAFQAMKVILKGRTIRFKVNGASCRVLWKTIKSWENWFVIPTRSASPLHCLIARRAHPEIPAGLQFVVDGDPVGVFEWQMQRGFAGILEEELRLIRRHLKVPAKLPEDEHVEPADAIAADILIAKMEDITDEFLQKCLYQRKLSDLGCATGDAELSTELMDDTMLAPDRKSFQDKIAEEKKRARERKTRSARIACLMTKARPHCKKRAVMKDPVAGKVARQERKHGAAWFATVKGDLATVIEYKPPGAVCAIDQIAGRFRMHHRLAPGSTRSVAWTMRGHEAAVRESLKIMWSWEVGLTGRSCPLPADMVGELYT